MVKIEERSLEERTAGEHCKTLMRLTGEIFRPARRITLLTPYKFTVGDHIRVDVLNQGVNVRHQEEFDAAVHLAEAYEKKIQREFTVKKEY